ncbi:MAG: nucleotidyltransferase family protein [Butyrivibrio sp.]|nr:nucleotidyltransferase family protein [Butyrivibrio sp.]
MKTTAIIAEFNPFHNGHKYLIEKARELTGADYIIIIMSSDFTQRGIPAITDKHSRAEMALICGADLVLELPSYYSLGSAEYFACGAVSILNKTGIVDYLAFGSECGNINLLTQIATCLNEESDTFKDNLSIELKKGKSYALARQNALIPELINKFDIDEKTIINTLSSPNNILAIEYIRALQKQNSRISPITISRTDGGYHQKSLPVCSTDTFNISTNEYDNSLISLKNNKNIDYFLASATAIRNQLFDHRNTIETNLKMISNFVPKKCLDTFKKELDRGCTLISENNYSEMLHYKLMMTPGHDYTVFADITEDFSNKIRNNLYNYSDFKSFALLLKSKDITYSRISRMLFHILLDIRTDRLTQYKDDNYTAYARILGLKKESSSLLKELKKSSSIPVIEKLSKADFSQNPLSERLFIETITASSIYDIKYNSHNINEYQKKLIII